MKILKNACVKGPEYSEGSGKSQWIKVGVLVEFNSGIQGVLLNRYFNPAGIEDTRGNGSILISFFDPDHTEKKKKEKPAPAPRPTEDPFEDDIPF